MPLHALLHELLRSVANPTIVFVVLLGSDLLALMSLPSVLKQHYGRPAATMSWLLALFALPWIGVVSWWLFGRNHLARRKRQRRSSHETFSAAIERPGGTAGPAFSGLLPASRHGFEPTHGNRVQILVNGNRAFPEMCASIRAAREQIHLVFYIWKNDTTGRRLRDLLAERAREGVKIRLLLDGWGTILLGGGHLDPLRRAGVQVATFLPVRPWVASALNFRNHRKLVIVDAKEAFTGGMNVGREYETDYHDLMVRIRGPAVAQLQDVFLDDWFYATGELLDAPPPPRHIGDVATAVLASGPDQWDNHVHDTLFLAIGQAQERVWVMTPYFVPGPAILAALRGAAQRGVDVRLLVPRRSDVLLAQVAGRALFPLLIEAGVRVYLYEHLLHGKAVLIDRDLCMIGSANTDNRSFRLNFELSGLFRSEPLARELERVFLADLARCRVLDIESARRSTLVREAAGSVVQLFARLL